MKKRIIETIGTISKEEVLCSLEEKLSNKTMILESHLPFPGYYHANPGGLQQAPRSLFFVTKEKYDEEFIIRKSIAVSEKTGISFDGAPGRVKVYNIPAYCIRVKGLESYQDVPQLVSSLKSAGFEFQKFTKVSNYDSVIRIQKFFELYEISQGVYSDARQTGWYYFEIPKQLTWEEFAKMTVEIKHNIDDPIFDAAIGTMYRYHRIVDMIRVYDSRCNEAKLENIHRYYLKKL